VQYFTRVDPSLDVVGNDVNVDMQTSAYSYSLDAALLDATLGWISSSSDLVRLFEALSAAAVNPSAAGTPLLTPSSVRAMLDRPSYDRPAPATSAEAQSKVWYGLGLVVDDEGRTFWHSGTLEGSTSVVAHDDDVGLTWAALINCRLEPNNDLWDFMRYAVRQAFGARRTTTPSPQQQPPSSYLSPPPSSSSTVAATAEEDLLWLQQHDSSVSDHNEAVRPEPETHSKGLDSDSEVSAVRQLVDSVSADGRTAVKLMVPFYRVSDVSSTVAATGYRLTWLDAVNYRGRIFFNVIWTRNIDRLRSSALVVHDVSKK